MKLFWALVLASSCIAFSSAAFADSIPVSDPTFAALPNTPLIDPCAGSGCAYEYLSGPWEDWNFANAGLFQSGSNTVYFNSLPNGPTTAFINQGGSISQLLSVTVQPDTTYTLDALIGNRIGAGLEGAAYLDIGGQLYQAIDLMPPGSGDWGTYTATFTCDSTCSQAGDSIEILLEASGFQGNFAGVQMFSSVPEPGVLSMLVLGLFVLAAFGWCRKRTGFAV